MTNIDLGEGMVSIARALIAACAAGSLVSACGGVPNLDLARRTPARVRYKVADIVQHLTCELSAAEEHYPLAERKYRISVLLTLKVDDNIDLTPSVSLINPMQNEKYSFGTMFSADLGGARQRTFTTNYTLEAEKLKGAPWCAKSEASRKALYQLNGDLGLAEVIRDGLSATTAADKGVHLAASPDDKAAPSFGSYIQFVVTRQLGALGPLWTVRRFKGPSGNNGLMNGKRLTTDSLTITFAASAPTPAKSDEERLAMDRLTAAVRDLAQQVAAEKVAQLDRDAKQARLATAARNFSATLNAPRLRNRLSAQAATGRELEAARASAGAASAAVQAQEARTAAAEADRRQAQEAVNLARLRTEAAGPNAAAATSQNLLGTILLQNLAGSQLPR